MSVKPEFVEYVRTMVRGDHEANDRIEAQLDELGWDGFPRFMSAHFFLSVDKHFAGGAGTGDIIKFVAELRAEAGDGGPAIDAAAAENLIKAVLDPSVDYDASQEMIGTIQAATVLNILTEEDPTDEELDAFLAEAARVASRDA